MTALGVVLLVLASVVGLALVPLGLPGLWIMVLGVIGFGWLTGFRSVGAGTIGIVLGLAALGEVIEAWIGFRFARRYGGSRRAGWGALVGGIVGAVVGVPVPIVGSVIGAFIGSFVGAAAFELTGSAAGGVAVLGRVAGAAVKVALGVIIAFIGLLAVLGS
jgi:uncharacterized protein YqgC (DUF456 family)